MKKLDDKANKDHLELVMMSNDLSARPFKLYPYQDEMLKAMAFDYWEMIEKADAFCSGLLLWTPRLSSMREQAIAEEGLRRRKKILKWFPERKWCEYIGGNIHEDSSWKDFTETTQQAMIFDEFKGQSSPKPSKPTCNLSLSISVCPEHQNLEDQYQPVHQDE